MQKWTLVRMECCFPIFGYFVIGFVDIDVCRNDWFSIAFSSPS